ncbi:MAG: AI-2E family transporter [Vampirovibrio sp.]|nr:AI-2E family transporter [Vampirovibrio sp.]
MPLSSKQPASTINNPSVIVGLLTNILSNVWLGRLLAGLLMVGNLVLLLWLIKTFQPVFNLVAMGLMLVYILLVPVNVLEEGFKKGLPFLRQGHRFLAVTLVYLALMYGLESLVIKGYPIVKDQAQDLIASLPSQLASANQRLIDLTHAIPFLKEPLAPILQKLKAWTVSSDDFMTQSVLLFRSQIQWLSAWVVQQAGPVLQSSIGQLSTLVTLLVFVFYALMNGEALVKTTVNRFPVAQQPLLSSFVNQLHCINMAFIKGQVLLGALTGVYMFIIYNLFGVKYALLLSIWFALAELLPVVGTVIGLIPGLLLITLQGDFMVLAYVYGCSYIFQTIKDNILQPHVVGNALGLHPILIILSLLLGAKIAGLVGVVIALPTGALLVFFLKTTIAKEWIDLPTEQHATRVILPTESVVQDGEGI